MPTITAERIPPPRGAHSRLRLGIALCVIAAVAELSTLMLRGGALDGADTAVREAVQSHDWGHLHLLMVGVSTVGGTVVAPALLLSLAAVLSAKSRRWAPLLVAGSAMVLLAVATAAGKGFIGRGPETIVDVAHVGASSFPSGPAITAVLAGGVAVLLLRGRITPPVHRTLCGLAVLFAVTVGIAQICLGGHQLSDVLASWTLGAGLLALVILSTTRQASTASFDTVTPRQRRPVT